MFRDIIDKEKQGLPYGSTGLTSQRWIDEVGVVYLDIDSLVATQPGVLLHALKDNYPDLSPHSGDIYPHIVEYRGVRYVEDGHHRIVRRLVQGYPGMLVRYLNLDEQQS